MSAIKNWLSAFRLRTLPLSLSGIITGSFAAYFVGEWNTLIFILAIFTTLFLQILSNLANDLGDSQKGADNADRVGPARTVQAGLISPTAMKRAVVLFALLSLSTAVPLIIIGTSEMPSEVLLIYVILAILCVLAAITYTVGKKAYGYHGLGDVMVFIFFGFVSVMGVFTLHTSTVDLSLIWLALTIGLLSVAVLNLNNMRDQINDKTVGKNTLVVSLGFKNAKRYHFSLIIISFIAYTSYCLTHSSPELLFGLLPFILLFRHVVFVQRTSDPKALDSELKKVALSTFFIAVLFSLTAVLWH